ncbi:uncharacterized protein STEHIDRAFT_118416 [Stereum hirsutum FP-91666 SS1]|uniref:uncharacterized protein n=1 Tax=Stereum hirsutum (strain FP-91666) TaxID=721885 RepID=UPI000440B37B|nr:uncharacterized protein STEHIDRAFT_118416 [Stereum hirsutum FP-91666 SS1]EIM91331.1 hypothetical protein STEHIDRAFT_118416 [Stereum hirsutum FP-91666 SS1]
MSAAEVAAAAAFERIVNITQIYIASTSSIWYWDWIVCLPAEWKYIWKSDWSAIKILYLFVRYYTLVDMIMADIWFLGEWTEEACAKNLKVLPYFTVLVDVSVELVLALRVYALFGRSRIVLIFLSIMMTGFTGVMLATCALGATYAKLPSWPGPCLIASQPSIAGPNFIIAFYASPMAVDLVLTAMTIWRSVRHKAMGSSSTRSLMNVFIKEGIFYFVAISSLNLINVIFFLQKNTLIQSINAAMSIQLSVVLSCRLVLNLRATRNRTSAPRINKFSNTLGRWVADFAAEDSTDPNASIALSPRPPHDRSTASIPQKDDQPTVGNGIMVRWEQEVNYGDNWGDRKRVDDPELGRDSVVVQE